MSSNPESTSNTNSKNTTPPIPKQQPPSPQRIQDLRRLFQKLDVNNTGRLTSKNLDYQKLRKFTPNPSKFIELADHDNDGTISEEEFIKYCLENESRIKKYFDQIDTKDDNVLDEGELRKAFQSAGIDFTEEQLQATINKLDRTGDKLVEKADWVWHFILVHGKNKDEFLHLAYENTHDRILHGVSHEEENDENGNSTFLKSMQKFVWSFPGPAAAKTLSAPFDRMKIFYQVYSDQWNTKEKGRMPLTRCAKMLYQEGGMRGMFRGNGINVIKSMPEQALKLHANKYIRQNFAEFNKKVEAVKRNQNRVHSITQECCPVVTCDCVTNQSKPSDNETNSSKNAKNYSLHLPLHQEIIAAGLSGLIAQTAVYPLDTLKIRMALARTNEYRNTTHAIKSIYNEPTSKPLQLCNFYRGFFSSLGVILYVAVELTTFNCLLPNLRKKAKDYGFSTHVGSALTGFIAPATGTILSYPLQLIRTKYQSDQRPKFGYYQFCKNYYKHGGIRSFYTGLAPNLAKSVISGGIILSWWSYVESRS